MTIQTGMRSGAIAAILLGVMSAVQGTAAAEQRALLIGIGVYKDIRSLAGPRHDLERMESFLTGRWGFRKDEIAILRDQRATRKRILNTARQWLVNSTQPGDRVVIYFSGHGSQVPDQDGDEKDGLDETLSPYDTGKNGDNQITDDEFSHLLDQMAGRDVTVIIDACHSGTIARGDIRDPNDPDADTVRTFVPELGTSRGNFDRSAHRQEESFVRTGGSRRVWSAAASNQFSWDSAGGGIFTRHFVEGAGDGRADGNGNGVIANAELLDYVRTQAGAYCQTNPRCKALGFTPGLESDDADLAKAALPPEATGTPAVTIQATDVVVHDNAAHVRIEVFPGDTVRLGQEMRIEVTSERHGWLMLLDVNARNEVTQLIPNEIMDRHGKSREIFPGQPMIVPDAYYGFTFNASEPVGEGTLLAIVTEDEDGLDSLLAANKALEVIAEPAGYLSVVAGKLMRIWKDDSRNRALEWSLGAKKYVVVP